MLNPNLKDAICPFNLDPTDLNHIKLLSDAPKYVRTFFVSTLPRFLSFASFFKPLFTTGNANTSIFINPINDGLAQSNLNSLVNTFEAEKSEALGHNNIKKAQATQQKKLEAEYLRDEISTSINKLFEISIFSSVFADSTEELNYLSESMGNELSKNTINLKSTWAEQLEGLKSNIPYCETKIPRNNTFDIFAAATIFPFISNTATHHSGMPLGIATRSGMPIIFDNFYSSLSNYNFMLLGKYLTGKKTTVKLLVLRSLILSNIYNTAIDFHGSYTGFVSEIDGINHKIAPSSNITINPFDIDIEVIFDEITGRERTVLNLKNKIEDVSNIIMIMARGSINSEYPNHITRDIIMKSVTEEYQDAGIDNNPESLFSSNGANLIGSRIARNKNTLPTLGSWYNRICRKGEANTNIDYRYHYDYLIKYMQPFIKELNASIPYFDGQTSIDFTKDSVFINFDISSLDEKFVRPLAQQVLLSWIWEKFLKSNNENREKAEKKRLIIDESTAMLSYPEAGLLLNNIFNRSITKNTCLFLISENFSEFAQSAELMKLVSAAGIKFIMGTKPEEAELIRETFNLTTGEKDFLESCLKGEGVLKLDKSSCEMYVTPFRYESEFIQS